MPAYPCAQCGHNVDLRKPTCEKCNTRTPFACIKCNEKIGIFDVYQADKQSYQKGLYCKKCGQGDERLHCYRCGEEVVRREAVYRTTVKQERLVYHPKCLAKFNRRVVLAKLAGFAMFVGLGAAGYFMLAGSSPVHGACGAFAGSAIGLYAGRMLNPSK
ncbi:MAG: hypothetical protein FJX76_11960 [Armatimonadetes bacterium]|nr:hypothetical protein [Armatimonadota bacterium]